jgi:hypothetical protein
MHRLRDRTEETYVGFYHRDFHTALLIVCRVKSSPFSRLFMPPDTTAVGKTVGEERTAGRPEQLKADLLTQHSVLVTLIHDALSVAKLFVHNRADSQHSSLSV